jgi:hypothetical protein
MSLETVGIVVIFVGLLMILVGVIISWQEFRQSRTLGVTSFVQALKDLVLAVANKGPSLMLLAFGTLLVFLGGVFAGAGGLTSP